MKRFLTAAALIGFATAAYAQPTTDSNAGLIAVPATSKTEVYDGPNSPGLPGQPAPAPGYTAPASPSATGGEYPFCSATVRDNCRQRRDPSY